MDVHSKVNYKTLSGSRAISSVKNFEHNSKIKANTLDKSTKDNTICN